MVSATTSVHENTPQHVHILKFPTKTLNTTVSFQQKIGNPTSALATPS